MQFAKPVGPQAASRKYDLLSAMMAFGLSGDRGTQTRVMRLSALITARYNWQRDELCVGQREIARLWSVDERTVKREMARLRTMGWLVQKTRGARGRISVYGLDIVQIFEDTRPTWPLIGEDFVARLNPGADAVEMESNVVPLQRRAMPVPEGQGVWGRAQAILADEQPALFQSWLAHVTEIETRQGTVTLCAPSAFHQSYIETHFQQALMAVLRRVDPGVARIEIEH